MFATSGFNPTRVGTQTITLRYQGRSATFSVIVQPLTVITLDIDNLIITDVGTGLAVFDIGTVSLSKSGTKTQAFTFEEEGCTNIAWFVEGSKMGSGADFTLNAETFNPGTYTLSLAFTSDSDGKGWLASLDFEVTN